MAYISGGHEPLFIVNQAGVRISLKATGPVVGMMPGMPFKVQQIQIEPGEILIGFTDGVTEALSPAKSLFTKKRFLSLLEKPASTAFELIEQIKTDLFTHIDDAPQFDDITMIAAHRLSD
jgi:sigma-B regulation protein RsbU (phosphoserine phosphatase)